MTVRHWTKKIEVCFFQGGHTYKNMSNLIEQFLWSLYSVCWFKIEAVIATAAVNVRQRLSPSGSELLLVADVFMMCNNPGVLV